jgi:hypothetical protein
MRSMTPYAMQTRVASVKSVDCCQTRKGGPTTIGLLISMLHHRTHVNALEQNGWPRRLTSQLDHALRRRGSVAALARVRAAGRGYAATLAGSGRLPPFSTVADLHELLRMNDDAPWERIFQFCPFAVDVFGVYGAGVTVILQLFP